MMTLKDGLEGTNNTDSEKMAIENGYQQLDAQGIKEQIVGKQFLGGYLHGFKYITSVNSDGSLEGKNNYQHYDIGSWSIDTEENSLNVTWKYGWDNTKTHLYVIDNEIKMYDLETGVWRSSFIHQLSEAVNIKEYQF